MLRLKILFGLLVILILLGSMGAFSIRTIRENAEALDRVISRNYDFIGVIHDLRISTSMLDSYYLPELTRADEDEALNRDVFERQRLRIEEAGGFLVNRAETETEKKLAGELQAAVDNYLLAYGTVLALEPRERSRNLTYLQSQIHDASRRATEAAEQAFSFHEGALRAEDERASRMSRRSAKWLTTGIVVATLIAVIAWWQFGRWMLKPLTDLTSSVREIQKRNFELTIPVPSNDEIGELTRAFNEMAAELNLLHRDTADRLLQLNLENRAVLAAFPHPIFILDPQGRLSQSNPVAERLMAALETGNRLPAKVEAHYQIARDSEEDYLPEDPFESILIRVDDRELFYLPRIFRIEGENGLARGWAVALLDVTRFRWLDEMKTNMLSTISHEIKTPLTSIRLVLHLILEEKTGPLNDKQRSALDSARVDCERLLETLEQLLELTRSEAGAGRLNLETVPPNQLVEEACGAFTETAGEQGSELETNLSGDLVPVRADRVRIRQVFQNLLSNALKYGPDGGRIVVSARSCGEDFVRFSVTDEGEGIPDELQGHLFERFYRAPGQEAEGVGLGLSICREIVQAHNGRIGVESEPGRPTEFYFDLPTGDS